MKNEHYVWLNHNKILLGNNNPDTLQRDYMFKILSDVTGKETKFRGCGRCVQNMKRRLIIEMQKYEQ